MLYVGSSIITKTLPMLSMQSLQHGCSCSILIECPCFLIALLIFSQSCIHPSSCIPLAFPPFFCGGIVQLQSKLQSISVPVYSLLAAANQTLRCHGDRHLH